MSVCYLNNNHLTAHSQIKAFITNADRLSMQTALQHAVPVLNIPWHLEELSVSNVQSDNHEFTFIWKDFNIP